ncbi:hypothetical protein HDU96_005068, partial [Phlyctochytrium bullatum]
PKVANGRNRLSLLDLGDHYSSTDFAVAARIAEAIPRGANVHQVTQILLADQIARRRFKRTDDLSNEERLLSIKDKLLEALHYNGLIPEGYRYPDFELDLAALNEFHPAEYADDLE